MKIFRVPLFVFRFRNRRLRFERTQARLYKAQLVRVMLADLRRHRQLTGEDTIDERWEKIRGVQNRMIRLVTYRYWPRLRKELRRWDDRMLGFARLRVNRAMAELERLIKERDASLALRRKIDETIAEQERRREAEHGCSDEQTTERPYLRLVGEGDASIAESG